MANPINRATFKNPVKSMRPDKDSDTTFKASGYAIHSWEMTEMSIALLYLAIVSPSHSNTINQVALSSLSAISTPKQKSEMLRIAGAVFFNNSNSTLKKKLNDLLDIYKDAASRRNDIAHGIVHGTIKDYKKQNEIEHYLSPSYLSIRNRPFPNRIEKYRYGSEDIRELAEKFHLLRNEIDDLREKILADWRSRHQKSDQ